jgi:hypothetical protein
MELKDFVSRALVEITDGVLEAQGELRPKGAQVNPKISRFLPKGESNYEPYALAADGRRPVLLVSFDVAVTASQGTKTKGGIGVVAGIVSLGTTGSTDKESANVSRISSKVPLLLPTQA